MADCDLSRYRIMAGYILTKNKSQLVKRFIQICSFIVRGLINLEKGVGWEEWN